MSQKLKICVLFGGQSTEHEVSRRSAFTVLNILDREKYDVTVVGITKNGDWLPFTGDLHKIEDGAWEAEAAALNGNSRGMEPGIRVLEQSELIFPVLHGINGEDGTIQGLLELLDIPYVGCNVLAAAVGMDKAFSKILFEKAGIPQCKYVVAHRHILEKNSDAYITEIEESLGYPVFIKPSNSGSSVGVFKAKDRAELVKGLRQAAVYDRKVIVEEFVDGREIECAVLGNLEPEAALPGEIIPSKEFYDYEDKYICGTSVMEIPAKIPEEKLLEVQRLAIAAFQAIDASGLSRVDFFYHRKTGEIILNEINTMPGFTDISLYAKAWEHMGVSYGALVDRLIGLALRRKEENKRG